MLVAAAACSVSCNKFLDEAPDNRAELDQTEKITGLLNSAYPENLFVYTTEMMSDNVDHKESTQGSDGLFQDELYEWADPTEDNNESIKAVWESYYGAITAANQALDAIALMGNPKELDPQRGEALAARAYYHFLMVNIFGLHYNPATSGSDLGVPYVEVAENTVNPIYKRQSVAEVYAKIEKDIEEALPLIDDNAYTVPKYHFNRKAAYSFAARFFLYYQKFDKTIEYASEVLGEKPEGMMRKWSEFKTLAQNVDAWWRNYIKADENSNLLIFTGYSNVGVVFGPYLSGKKYPHGTLLANTETSRSAGPWGTYSSAGWYFTPWRYANSSYDFVIFWKIPYMFEYTDKIAGIGYRRSVYPAFTGEETLLCRAEAYIMKKQYDRATDDLALWMKVRTSAGVPLTRAKINEFYSAIDYYTPTAPTVKKRLNPQGFQIVSAEQENYLQCLLHFRRIETLVDGLRWFDIKRFGIEIYRRYIDINDQVAKVTDSLLIDDPRRAIQLPQDVIGAGLEPNPRN